VLLIQTTISSYNNDQNKYPAKVAAYHTAQHAYPAMVAAYHAAQQTYSTKLAAYDQAIKNHVKPLPVAPAKPVAPAQPVAPTKPSLSIASFALPGLYAILSLAYIFLAYRAGQARRNTTSPPAGAK
jgi:hypothetical protein